MARLNFSLRQLLLAVTFVSIPLGVLVWIAQYSPDTFFYALVFTFPIGIFGIGVVALATVMLISAFASSHSTERNQSIAKCNNLALIGALMIALPILAAFGNFILLPMIQPVGTVALAQGQIAESARFAGGAENDQKASIAKGESVTELDKAIFYVFQAKDDTYWFGSNERGVYRYDGKALVNFTMKDGLVSNRIRGIQEDQDGNVYFTTYEGISKFDGQVFATLINTPSTEWKKQPDDLWFVGSPDTGAVYRYDGKTLHRLAIPKSRIGEEVAARFPRSQFPNAIFSPYDVYTISKDSNGNIWFGTASAGAGRFDGQSFTWLYEDHLTNVEGGGSFGIRSVIEDKSGALWICNTRYRFRVDAQGAPEPEREHIRYKREKGIELRAPDGKDHVYFMSALEDKNGVLWIASGRFGVWRYERDQVTRYPVKDGGRDITLFSIYQDTRGDLWLGTHDAGAYRFNGKTFEQFRP